MAEGLVQLAPVEHHVALEDYGAVAHLAQAVQELRAHAAQVLPALRGRTLWMVNSTAQGGGVAEMLPTMVALLRDLGFSVEWAVISPGEPDFFALTKRLHNLIHGAGDPGLGEAERNLYERVSRACAEALGALVGPRDLLVIHDPQPAGVGALVREALGVPAVWRCHIGIEEQVPETRAAWRFLEPYVTAYDAAVFTAAEYIPSYLTGRARVIHPAIDPLSHKNRPLSLHKLVGVMRCGALVPAYGPVIAPAYAEPVLRLQPTGDWRAATDPEDIGLLFRPIVTQVSRWDRLKGLAPLLEAFALLKRSLSGGGPARSAVHQRTVELVRLVLAGPAPGAVADDPEATAVLDDLRSAYLALEPAVQQDVALLLLPMGSRKENALLVNALQHASSVVAQNSLREGFGLTAAEAMWKRVPVLGSPARGLQIQVRDGLDGRIGPDPADPAAVAAVLDEMLKDEGGRTRMGERAQRRVHDEFLIFTQLRQWLELLAPLAA